MIQCSNKKSFTLVEVLVGTFLILLIFLGIFGAYQLAMKVVGLSKNKIVATAIANQQLEIIRNLPYHSVGTKGAVLPFAKGVLDPTTTTIRNNIEYKIFTQVKYIVDSADGLASPPDSCHLDYKRAEIKVSWSGLFKGEVKLVTDLAPKNKIEEIESCIAQPGGILSVTVFDAYGNMVSFPLIEIFDVLTGEKITSYSPSNGKFDFPLATSTYKVVVSKDGYSSEQTYGSGEIYHGKTIITPEKPHPIILKGQVTQVSFSIDKLSSFLVKTLSPWGSDNFTDSFSDESKISEKVNLVVSNGEVKLATTTEGEYHLSGYLFSIPLSPANLIRWDKFFFNDSEPLSTDLKYQIFYATDTDWLLIPETDLPGNSIGFDSSPIDLSNLATSTYFKLKLKANFSTQATQTTPLLSDWQISWLNTQPTPIGKVTFNLRGEKIVGLDSNDAPIYKYFLTTSTDATGKKNLSNLEWDAYTFSIDVATGLDLITISPSPQPIGLGPNTNLEVNLYLKAQNSLLVTVQNLATLEPVFSASVRLYNHDLKYDVTHYTNEKGQAFFLPLEVDNYNLEVSASGYLATSTTVFVSGDRTKIIKLEQIE